MLHTNSNSLITRDGAVLSAAFTVDIFSPVAGQAITFTNYSRGAISYSWDFGDGTIPNTATNPTHYFVGNGPYTVSLTATSLAGKSKTATMSISPTTPSATAGMTQLQYEDFDTALSYGSPGSFTLFNHDAKLTAFNGPIPSGAKLAGAAGVGWSGGQSVNMNYGRWNVGSIPASGTYYQISGWFKISQLPSGATKPMLAGWTHRNYDNFGFLSDGIFVDSAGALSTTSGGSLGKTITLNRWFWLGCCLGEYSAFDGKGRVLYKEIGSSVEVLATNFAFSGFNGSFNMDATIGSFFNATYTLDFKLTGAALHSATTLAALTYPNEIVQPQSESYVYNLDPVSGNDTNNGITDPILTTGAANTLMLWGLDSGYTDGTAGSGPWLKIDTSSQWFDVGTVGLQIRTPGMWVKPVTGQSYVKFRPFIVASAGGWSATGGHAGVYQRTILTDTCRVWCDGVYYALVADLAALDLAATKAFCVVSNVLYIKPDTNPTSDGKEYIYSRIRPFYPGDPVGMPVVAIAGRDVRVTGAYSRYGAYNVGGGYFVGDITGFSGKVLIEDFDFDQADKHAITWSQTATNSSKIVRNGFAGCAQTQVIVDYGGGGSGNTSRWEKVDCQYPIIVERSASGANDPGGTGYGAYYQHGTGSGIIASVDVVSCNWGNSPITTEGTSAATAYNGSTFGAMTELSPVTLKNCTIGFVPGARQGLTMTGCTVQMTAVTLRNTSEYLAGDVLISNNTFNLDFAEPGTIVGLWEPDLVYVPTGLNLTFTNNTVRFPVASGSLGSRPLFDGMASADIVSCNNNTYYILAGAIFARNFNAGGGSANYTFAQWQALGYDTASTRIDP